MIRMNPDPIITKIIVRYFEIQSVKYHLIDFSVLRQLMIKMAFFTAFFEDDLSPSKRLGA